MNRSSFLAAFPVWPALLCIALAAMPLCAAVPAASGADQAGLLNIHVTAVQGGAQFRPSADAKWAAITAGLDVPEGVEFRTGPKGTVQFTIGTDQVFRVDRLSVIKVLRANLNDDGTIHTDVGMTYGRVSKDVDLPQHPHQDTIISPSSTLAVRGTEVSMFDSPPFTPEATSLTGKALYHNFGGQQTSFGSRGGGANTVSGDTPNAAQHQLNNGLVDPIGQFSGHTGADLQNIQNVPGGLAGTPGNQFQQGQQIIGGMSNTTHVVPSSPSSSFTTGILTFIYTWTSFTTNTRVELDIVDPGGVTISNINPPMNVSATNGPFLVGSAVASNVIGLSPTVFSGSTGFTFGSTSPNSGFLSGAYQVTTTILGTDIQTLAQNPSAKAQGTLLVGQAVPPTMNMAARIIGQQNSGTYFLQTGGARATFNFTTPIGNGTAVPAIIPVSQ